MLNFDCDNHKLSPELRDIIRMFVPFFDVDLSIIMRQNGQQIITKIEQKEYVLLTKTGDKKDEHRQIKNALYIALSDYFNKPLPWGSLTGIRPTKIGYNHIASGGSVETVAEMLQKDYFVSQNKAEITANVIKNQRNYIKNEGVNVYVHIPFCPTRCSFCSFVSLPAAKNQALMAEYLDLLNREITATNQLIKQQNQPILSTYIGGGTPATLDENQLVALLKTINAEGKEFTFEAGRPDVITKQKLSILRDFGVTRVCINPQTFAEKTLKLIGRQHSIEQTYRTFDMAREMGFSINMDLIAGLEGEDISDFSDTIRQAIALKPSNITVHTLSVKNGSKISENVLKTLAKQAQNQRKNNDGLSAENSDYYSDLLLKNASFGQNLSVEKMVEYAQKSLTESGYLPYYLYRQKNMLSSAENIGYCLDGQQSVNNITTMEETASVYASGAGAISKKISGSRIDRHASLRDVALYIQQFESRLQQKKDFFNDSLK